MLVGKSIGCAFRDKIFFPPNVIYMNVQIENKVVPYDDNLISSSFSQFYYAQIHSYWVMYLEEQTPPPIPPQFL